MQLSIRDLTRLLEVSESTIKQWIKQRGLPAQQVAGRYHVNRSELLEWATSNNIKVSLELFDDWDSDAETVPSLTEALEAGGIHYQLTNSSKKQALRALVQVLPVPGDVDRELLLQLFLAHPVDFEALDGRPVHVLFTIISPTARSHLQMLSRLSFALYDVRFREAVIRQAPREEILRELRRIESRMGTAGFVGTELLVDGAVEQNPTLGIAVVLAAALNSIAIVQAYFRLFTGTVHVSTVDMRINGRERLAVLTLAALLLIGGLFPQPAVLSRHHDAQELLDQRTAFNPDLDSSPEP